jgi:3-deoxy-D-manno-octulosonate 8-phosphate phosphatase (KDO 8-P phosphatase)
MQPLSVFSQLHLLIFDVDGIFTDGELWQDARGEFRRTFSVRDAMAIRKIRAAGLRVAILTRHQSPEIQAHFRGLGVDALIDSCEKKSESLAELMQRFGVEAGQVALMSRDDRDIHLFSLPLLGVTVSSASYELRAAADCVTIRTGGDGAVSEFCGRLLKELRNEQQDSSSTHSFRSRRSGWRRGRTGEAR